MKVNKRLMRQRRQKIATEDRELREKSIAFLDSRLLRKGFWWYVLQENNRGLLSPVARFPTQRAACDFVDGT